MVDTTAKTKVEKNLDDKVVQMKQRHKKAEQAEAEAETTQTEVKKGEKVEVQTPVPDNEAPAERDERANRGVGAEAPANEDKPAEMTPEQIEFQKKVEEAQEKFDAMTHEEKVVELLKAISINTQAMLNQQAVTNQGLGHLINMQAETAKRIDEVLARGSKRGVTKSPKSKRR